MPWTLPAVLPSTADLRAALLILEAQMAPATRKHIAWCLAKLRMAFEPTSKLSDDETSLRASVWLEACGDLGDQLWSKATLLAIQSSKWMPKPAEFRLLVDQQFADRAKRLKRCREMLNGVRPGPATEGAFVPEPEDVRLRTLRDSLKRVGRMDRAAGYEMRLASLEARQPEEWAVNPPAPQPIAERFDLPKLPPPSAETRARTMVAAAAFHRKQGHAGIADMHMADARKLCPEIFEETDHG